MKPYTVKDVAKMLELTSAQVRSFAKSEWLQPSRDKRGVLRFSFQDLVLLRTAKELVAAKVQRSACIAFLIPSAASCPKVDL